ncbi:cysteine desulfurase family protein [uncultured Anaerococcus sp.]|uniref:cysteine desulfurase family protein n=1 Tax=uncultured Anaerococcus sp. TaxID=293428 RepID=UPI002635BF8D|nr:cysteine desulfurase family protein [uncultured Anaerococcus sp.]
MIYLDNAATTKMYDEALEAYVDVCKNYFANPSALHSYGMDAENLIKDTKKYIGKLISADESEIFFTKSATESNNIAIKSFDGLALTSKIEHSSVFNTFKNANFKEVRYIANDRYGFIDEEDLRNKLDKDVNFVSFIYVNNEIGTIQNIKKLTKIIKDFNKDIVIHIDATQAMGKIPCDVNNLGVDMMSFSAHKFHGPKQLGGLFVRKEIQGKIKPILDGGYQEIISSGTNNPPAIYACGIALKKQAESNEYQYIEKLNQYLRSEIEKNIEDSYIISPLKSSSPYILDVAFANIKSEVLLHMLEEEEIYVSSGSACSKGDYSRILTALGIDKRYMDGAIRFSFSAEITKEDLDFTLKILKDSIEMIRMVI